MFFPEKKTAGILLPILVLLVSSCGYYHTWFVKNVAKDGYIYIYSSKPFSYSIEQMPDSLFKDRAAFVASVYRSGDTSAWRPGRYQLKKGMKDRDVINLLKSGSQQPVKVVLTYARLRETIAGRVPNKIEADSASLMKAMNDPRFLDSLGTDTGNVIGLFIPNTYELYWNTDAYGFMRRMKKEYDRFWNAERLEKARKLGLTKEQVTVLGSIVQSEQSRIASEWPRIAGLYLNRLRIGMPLQSDPTVLFALRKFTASRVYYADLEVNSPYNTYKNSGLPPGPICMVQPGVLDAVLNAEENKYLYMCASEALDGTHKFAATLAEHTRNARAFQRALNQRNIR